MSSDLQNEVVFFLQQNNALLVAFASVTYDYVLTFPRELDYIWYKPWSWVSTLFVLVRYLGLCHSLVYVFLEFTSFNSVTVSVSTPPCSVLRHFSDRAHGHFKGTVFYFVAIWTLQLFRAAADLVMILRVYAMWRRSKIILGILLFLYVPQAIITFIFYGMATLSMSITQALNASICVSLLDSASPPWLSVIPHFVYSVVLLILPVIQSFGQSLEMYRATKQWQPNRYLQLLVTDGILYFLVHVSYDIRTLIFWGFVTLSDASMFALDASAILLLFTMLPRFIIGIREMYDQDIHRQRGVDSGFGIFSPVLVASTITFADVVPPVEEETDRREVISLGTLGSSASQV